MTDLVAYMWCGWQKDSCIPSVQYHGVHDWLPGARECHPHDSSHWSVLPAWSASQPPQSAPLGRPSAKGKSHDHPFEKGAIVTELEVEGAKSLLHEKSIPCTLWEGIFIHSSSSPKLSNLDIPLSFTPNLPPRCPKKSIKKLITFTTILHTCFSLAGGGTTLPLVSPASLLQYLLSCVLHCFLSISLLWHLLHCFIKILMVGCLAC